jgi:hypothetical protein
MDRRKKKKILSVKGLHSLVWRQRFSSFAFPSSYVSFQVCCRTVLDTCLDSGVKLRRTQYNDYLCGMWEGNNPLSDPLLYEIVMKNEKGEGDQARSSE